MPCGLSTVCFMYIRASSQIAKNTAKKYWTYRLVDGIRTSRGVRQQLLLNLGSKFAVPKEQWQELANRIEEIATGQQVIFEPSPELEKLARKYAKELTLRQSSAGVPKPTSASVTASNFQVEADYHSVDINSISNSNISTVGGEHVSHQTILQLGLDEQLKALGFSSVQVSAAIGTIIGRLLHPGSELGTHGWLQEKSGLGELIDYDFQRLSLDKFYKISDTLLSKKDELEQFLHEKEKTLFNLDETVALYDLTNTYFEGGARANEKAKFGRSKEKRSDCPLVTLALVLNSDGFPKATQILPGNISEPKTLSEALSKLALSSGATKPTIIMDAGIATEDNLKHLRTEGYTYVVVSRKRNPVMPKDGGKIFVKAKDGNVVTAKLVHNTETSECELYCHSTCKEHKEQSMQDSFCKRYEEGLAELAKGLHKKGCTKTYDKILVALGRLKEKNKRISGRYEVTVEKDDKITATSITWSKKEEESSSNGVYCLRTNNLDWSEREIWKTYMTLTEIESSFRCMKSELGMRPVYHQLTHRVDGHLFITVLAYHVMHSIRHQLKKCDIDFSWETLREMLSEQYRITTMMKKDDGKTINVRTTSEPTQGIRQIYKALSLTHYPGKKKIVII